jgi:hypothetical protein
MLAALIAPPDIDGSDIAIPQIDIARKLEGNRIPIAT